MTIYSQLYIDGQWVDPSGHRTFGVIGAATGMSIARISCATLEDVDRAVYAAMSAFTDWSQRSMQERAGYLRAIHAGLEARSEEIARLITSEVGMPLVDARRYQVAFPLQAAAYYIDPQNEEWLSQQGDKILVEREPIGVVAAITPWGYPLHHVLAKLMPALLAGCTVVLKPSPEAPLSAFVLAQVVEAVGLPAGVFNLVLDEGTQVGEALVSHSGVDMVSFSGSTLAGKRVTKVASRSLKRVALQLSGKSPSIILEDADLEQAVTGSLRRGLLNSGQTCIAHTRLLVPQCHYAEAEKLACEQIRSIPLVDPLSEQEGVGPLCSDKHRAQVQYYIRQGIEEGAVLLVGGPDNPDIPATPRGFYVKPTLFGQVKNEMCIAQEEVFGPVICLIPYHHEEEAVRLANDSIYGLSAAVWSRDPARALAVARQLQVGQVHINDGDLNAQAPFGGYKQSGNGRELGRYGLEAYLQYKAILF